VRLFALLFAFMAWSSQVEAEVFDPNFELSQIKGVSVYLIDDAKGACWTNLKEVREYAEEKLHMRGVKGVDGQTSLTMEQNYLFSIAVHSRRLLKDGSGHCWGSIRVILSTVTMINGNRHKALIGEYSAGSLLKTNQNRRVIEAVSEFLAEFK